MTTNDSGRSDNGSEEPSFDPSDDISLLDIGTEYADRGGFKDRPEDNSTEDLQFLLRYLQVSLNQASTNPNPEVANRAAYMATAAATKVQKWASWRFDDTSEAALSAISERD